MAATHAKHHDYHLVNPSPWPVTASLSALFMAVGLVIWMRSMHGGTGLFGLNAKWAFFENEHVALSAQLGFLYAHGGWLWLLSELGQTVLSDSDLFGVPLGVTVSVPWTRWLQFDLLLEFARSAGRWLSKEQLSERLYGWDDGVESNALEVHVHHLRRKLDPTLIVTQRGVGYMLRVQAPA